MTHEVAVFGGGVGGLTVAHELARVAKAKVHVTVYERNTVTGGKARSFRKPGSEAGGQALPGEHGFRFFPGYYRHVIKTMKRIPYPAGGPMATVADNLVDAPETHFARTDGPALELSNRFPSSVQEIAQLFSFGPEVDIPMSDALRFAKRLRDLLCACDDRRFHEFEQISWFDFCEADKGSADYRKYLADGLNQRTVAASGKDVSARTVGLTLIRIMNDWLHPGSCIDRVLNGPTSERWLEPWRDQLSGLGVSFELDATLTEVGWSEADGVQSATVRDASGATRTVTADSYVMAIPMADAKQVVLASSLATYETGLAGFADETYAPLRDDWMNGIQLYLDGPLDLAAGHTIFVDSAFSLTSISQRQFWEDVDFDDLGDGRVQAILSVDISDWDQPCACHGKTAKEMTREEVKDEVLAQLMAHMVASYPDQPMPKVLDWFLDPAIVELPAASTGGSRLENREGLFINTTSSWSNRPAAVLRDDHGLANLYLASDYVRTNADLATMEGANEAGRMAARGVLEQMGERRSVRNKVELYDFPEPFMFTGFRVADRILYNTPQGPQIPGLPHTDAPRPQAPENLPDSWEVPDPVS